MKKLIFLGSILGTLVVFLVACFVVVTMLIWLVRQWEPAPWLVWAVGLGMTGAAVAVIWRWWRLPVERRFRFSMRGMLVGMMLFALWAGTAGTDLLRWGRRTAVLADLFGHGVTVDYFYHSPRTLLSGVSTRVFGHDLLEEVYCLEIRRDQGLDALLEHRDDFPDLEFVVFCGGWVTNAGFARVEELNSSPNVRGVAIDGCTVSDSVLERLTDWPQLEVLHLENCAKITDAGLTHLHELPNLTILRLVQQNAGKMPITDAGLAHVADLQQLEYVVIAGIPVTDAGLAHVASLSRLRGLTLTSIPVTDAGIAQLQGLERLERIDFHRTKVTEEGINRLCEALPDCSVLWEGTSFPAVCQTRRIEVWKLEPEARLLATVTDADRIAEIKEWLDENQARLQDTLNRSRKSWMSEEDGPSGAWVRVRFEGRSRRMCEIGLGSGVYESRWGTYCPMGPAAEKEIRVLLGVDASEWNTVEVD